MNYTIENEQISLTVSTLGAQMQSLKNKENGLEYLWQRDKQFWGRTAPVLFPIVGKIVNDEYRCDGKTYKLGQHGFARDMEFELTSQTEDTLTFTLKSNEETLKLYPYQFELAITYFILGNKVDVRWDVKNTDSKEIYFSIGGHPAFNCPILPDTKQTDYRIGIDSLNEKIVYHEFEDGYVTDNYKEFPLVDGGIQITEHTFDHDAYVIEPDTITKNSQAYAYSLIDPNGKKYVTVTSAAPLMGLWSPPKKSAPFVCIEPWYGRCDHKDFQGEWQEREWGNRLDVAETFEGGFTIAIA